MQYQRCIEIILFIPVAKHGHARKAVYVCFVLDTIKVLVQTLLRIIVMLLIVFTQMEGLFQYNSLLHKQYVPHVS